MEWQTVEMLGYTYFSELKWRILVPLVDNSDYDFCIEKSGIFRRVNVKLAGLKDKSNPNSWSIALSSGSGKSLLKPSKVDLYLAYLPEQKKFIELPGDFFVGSKSKSKRIPVKLLK